MDVLLKENERIDDLERNGLKIIQNKNGFCFGIDAVLLSAFASEAIKNETSMIDLGTGTGILPLLLYAKTNIKKIVGLEIQPQSAEMAVRSVKLNKLEDNIKIVEGDIKEASKIFEKASFDIVTSNPPYIKAASGIVNPASEKAVARHEIHCSFEDVARESAALLRPGGKFFLVHRPQRLAEIICTLREYRLEPKRLQLIHSFADSEATLFLMEAANGGNPELRIEKPLVIYKNVGEYTKEIEDMYHF